MVAESYRLTKRTKSGAFKQTSPKFHRLERSSSRGPLTKRKLLHAKAFPLPACGGHGTGPGRARTVMRPGPTTPEWWRLAFRSWKRPANGKPPPRAGSLFMKRVPVPLWHGAGPRPHARKPHEGLGPGWWLAQRETVGEASHLPAVLASPTAGRRALCRQRPCGPWRGAPPRSNPTPGQRPPSRVPRSQSIPGDAAQILCATSQNQDGCRAGPSGPPRSLAGSNPPGGE